MLRLFVGNLPNACDEDALCAWFVQQGHHASSAQVVRDRTTGHSRGFGFVELQDASNLAETIQILSGKAMLGRVLTINGATPKVSSRPEFRSSAA